MDISKTQQAVTPFLWYNTEAEEAANLYCSIFDNARVLNVRRWPAGSPFPEGSAMSATFEIDGVQFTAFNGGPAVTFNWAVSMSVNCTSQEQVDRYWDAILASGGKPAQCGWIADKFGLSWQIVPEALGRLMGDKDPAKAKRVMEAMMKMVKLEVPKLEAAYNGE